MVKVIQALAYISLLMGFLMLLHQYIVHGVWFEIADIHHETLSIAFLSFGFGILLGFVSKTGKS